MKLFFAPVPHQEALDFLRTRPAVSRAIFDELAPDLKAISFVVTGIDDASQLQTVKNILARLPAGTNYEDVKEQIIAVLPFSGKRAERRAELLLRHWGGDRLCGGPVAPYGPAAGCLPVVAVCDDE